LIKNGANIEAEDKNLRRPLHLGINKKLFNQIKFSKYSLFKPLKPTV
jgi:hypothetical protein